MPVMLHADCMGGGGKESPTVTSRLGGPLLGSEICEVRRRSRRRPNRNVGFGPHLVSEIMQNREWKCVCGPSFTGPRRWFLSLHPQGSSGSSVRPCGFCAIRIRGGSWPLQWESADVPSADDRWGVGSHDAKKLIGGASERASECEKKWWAHFGDGYGCTRVSGKTRALSPLKETGLIFFFRGGVCVETGSLRRRLTSVRGNRTNPMACLPGPEMARAMVPLGYYFRRILLGLDSAGVRQPDMVPPPET